MKLSGLHKADETDERKRDVDESIDRLSWREDVIEKILMSISGKRVQRTKIGNSVQKEKTVVIFEITFRLYIFVNDVMTLQKLTPKTINTMAEELNETNPVPTDEKQDIEKNKVMAVLAYFGILVLVPLLAAKDSKFARFHANQGLVLFIAYILYYIIYAILAKISGWIALIWGLVAIVLLVFAIIGIINAAKGEYKELPLIGGIKILK